MKLTKYVFTALVSLSSTIFQAADSFCQEELQYKNFKLEACACYVGVSYKKDGDKTRVGVSAIATGKGAEFRKWDILSVRLKVGDERIKPESEGKFYVRKESFFRVPAAVLFAVIGATADVPGTGLERGITQAGLAVGLGLLAMQARGEITGEKYFFTLDKETAAGIVEGRDFIEVAAEDQDMHLKETLKIGIIRTPSAAKRGPDYSRMSDVQLTGVLNTLEGRLNSLETEQASYKYGEDPEYDRIQKDIEEAETQRGIAYRAWLGKYGAAKMGPSQKAPARKK